MPWECWGLSCAQPPRVGWEDENAFLISSSILPLEKPELGLVDSYSSDAPVLGEEPGSRHPGSESYLLPLVHL